MDYDPSALVVPALTFVGGLVTGVIAHKYWLPNLYKRQLSLQAQAKRTESMREALNRLYTLFGNAKRTLQDYTAGFNVDHVPDPVSGEDTIRFDQTAMQAKAHRAEQMVSELREIVSDLEDTLAKVDVDLMASSPQLHRILHSAIGTLRIPIQPQVLDSSGVSVERSDVVLARFPETLLWSAYLVGEHVSTPIDDALVMIPRWMAGDPVTLPAEHPLKVD